VGGTTSRYSEIGSPRNAITPPRNIRSDSTPAKIGRSMKNLERSIALLSAGGASSGRGGRIALRCGFDFALQLGLRGHAHGLRLQQRAGTHALQAVDDDTLAGLEAFGDHAQTVHRRAERHFAVLGLVVRADDEHELLALVGAHCALVD